MLPIAFAALLALQPAAEPTGQIAFNRAGAVWLINLSTNTEHKLTDLPGYDRPLAWSPDGRSLLFWKHASGWDIWRITVSDTAAADPTNLTNTTSGGCRSAAYSPDGRHIAFMRDDPQGLYIMAADGSGQRRLTDRGHRDAAPAWSPDGRTVAYTHIAGDLMQVRLIGPDGTGDRPLPFPGNSHEPAWSPDGRSILISGSTGKDWDLFLVPLDGADPRPLARTPQNEGHPAWSPDGNSIAFVRRSGEDRHDVLIIPASGGEARALGVLAGRPEALTWSPDSTYVAFASGPGGSQKLMIAPASGGPAREVAAGGTLMPAWRPRLRVPQP